MIVLLSLGAIPTQAQDYSQADALRGLKSVSVSVSLSSREDPNAVDTAAIRTSIEVELRRDGIEISTSPSAYLDVNIVVMSVHNALGTDLGYSYAMQMMLLQAVSFPARPGAFGTAYGWVSGMRIGVGADKEGLLRMLQDKAREDAETFANDWLRVHQAAGK